MNSYWEELSTPCVDSFDRRRILLVEQFSRRENSLRVLAKKFQFFTSGFKGADSILAVEKHLKEEYFAIFKGKAKESIEKIINEKKERYEKYGAFSKKLNPQQKKFADFLQTAFELRDLRKDFIAMGTVVVFRYLDVTFTKLRIPKKYIPFVAYSEVIKGEENIKKITKELPKRYREGVAILSPYQEEESITIVDAKILKEILNSKYLSQNVQEDHSIIRGVIGARGQIKGRVKIIINIKKESIKFEDGDILVTSMTRPEFVPLMKKALAIVTDEGGITCHAAIVSRELNKPCVINAKIATQVLKDGDLVEVDANEGVVRILERALK